MANSKTTYSSGKVALPRELQFLPNGKTMFCSNQTTLDMRSPAPNFSLSSQLIVSLDDIGYNTNQSECVGAVTDSVSGDFNIAVIDTFLLAVSIRSNDNRFEEGVSLTFLSLLSLGIMNLAIGNVATHCLVVISVKPVDPAILEATNLVLIETGLCRSKGDGYKKAMKFPMK